MTDNEIIKALECCIIQCSVCKQCPLLPIKDNRGKCYTNLKKQALDLINRLQAENERLKPFENKIVGFNSHIRVEDMLVFASSLEEWLEFCDNLKAEAYKECIQKVKEEIYEALKSNYKARSERIDKHNVGDKTDFISYCGGKIDCLRGLDDFLDNLLKELVGEDK